MFFPAETLSNLPYARQGEYVKEFVDEGKRRGPDYRCKKVTVTGGQSIFDLIRKDKIAHEIRIYLPDEMWRREDTVSMPPLHGARYCICRGRSDGVKILDDLHKLTWPMTAP